MANGLIGGFGSFGRGQTQGSLLGNVFQEQPTAGQLRRGLFNEVVQQYSGNAQQTGGAAIGAGLGIGISKLLGRDVEGAERADKIRRVQERVNSQFGEQFASDPYTAFSGTAQALIDEGLFAEGLAALDRAREYVPQAPDTQTYYGPDGTPVQASVNREGRLVTLDNEDITGQGFGTSRPERQSQRDLERDYYISQGYDERVANDLANNNIQAITNPFTKQPELVNITGGPVPDALPQGYDATRGTASVPTNEQGQPVQTSRTDQGAQQGAESGRSRMQGGGADVREPEGLIERPLQVGLVPYLQEGLSKTVGQVFPETFTFAQTTEDRTQLRSARQQLISSLAISEKPPVIEQERIEGNLPGLGPLESPERARTQLTQLTKDLLRQREADLRDINDTSLNPSLRRDIQKRVNGVERMLRLVDPRAIQTGEVTEAPEFSLDEAQSTLESGIQEGTVPQGASMGAYDREAKGYPIIVNGQPATNSEGEVLYIFEE